MNKRVQVSFFVAIGLVGAVFFVANWNLLPRGTHCWAQSDRLAQAYGYFFNGFVLSKPMLMAPSYCTGEFSVLAYIIGWSGKFVGLENIHITYRLVEIFLSVLGWSGFAYALFRKTGWWIGAFFGAALMSTIPFLAFFSYSFIQDAASLGVLLVGASVFWRSDKMLDKPAYLSLTLLTLAALIKTTSATFLIATALTQLWCWRKMGYRQWLPYLLAFGESLGLIVLHLVWMKNYNETYGCGVFLARAMPLKFGVNLLHDLDVVYATNKSILFTETHKVTLLLLAIMTILGLFLKLFPRWLVLQFLLVLGGAFGFFWQMGQQFLVHTYYLICSFVPVIAMLVAGGIYTLHHLFSRKKWLNVLLIATLGLAMMQSKHIYKYLDETKIDDAWIIEANIPSDFLVNAEAYILYVTASDAPNFPQVYFKRRGVIFNSKTVFANPDILLEHHRLFESKYVAISLADAAKLLADKTYGNQFSVLYRGNSYLILGFGL